MERVRRGQLHPKVQDDSRRKGPNLLAAQGLLPPGTALGARIDRLNRSGLNPKGNIAEYNSFPLGNRDDVEEKDFLNISNSSIFEHQSRKQSTTQDLDVLMNGRKARLNQRLDSKIKKNQSVGNVLTHAGTDCNSPGQSATGTKSKGSPITIKIQQKSSNRDSSQRLTHRKGTNFRKTESKHLKFKAQPLPVSLPAFSVANQREPSGEPEMLPKKEKAHRHAKMK